MIATDRKFRYRFATGWKLILFKLILLSSILVNNRVIVIENGQKKFQLELQLSTFENSQLQLHLQQNRVINYKFVSYNFSKPGLEAELHLEISSLFGYLQNRCPSSKPQTCPGWVPSFTKYKHLSFELVLNLNNNFTALLFTYLSYCL